jgi:hypothetical protein
MDVEDRYRLQEYMEALEEEWKFDKEFSLDETTVEDEEETLVLTRKGYCECVIL